MNTKNNNSPGGSAAHVNWNVVPMANTDSPPASAPVPLWHRVRRALLFLAPIALALLLFGCTSAPGDIARYNPNRGRAASVVSTAAVVPTPAVEIAPTVMPTSAPVHTSIVSDAPTTTINADSEQSNIIGLILYGGAWLAIGFVFGFLVGRAK